MKKYVKEDINKDAPKPRKRKL